MQYRQSTVVKTIQQKVDSVLGSWNDINYNTPSSFHYSINSGFVCEWETKVDLLYGPSLKSCNSAVNFSKTAEQDSDNDGIPNWKEVDSSLNLGYWDIDGTYVPASYANCLALKGIQNPLDRFNLNPLLISVACARVTCPCADGVACPSPAGYTCQ